MYNSIVQMLNSYCAVYTPLHVDLPLAEETTATWNKVRTSSRHAIISHSNAQALYTPSAAECFLGSTDALSAAPVLYVYVYTLCAK